jgi:hypothetical protein
MIQGLTDKGYALPQLGVLRKGAPKPEKGNAPGADLKHFRFDCDDTEAAAKFEAIYGNEPRAIRILLPFATTDENFDAWREAWTSSSLQHRCDGATCVRHLTARGTYSDEPIPCPGGCKQVGRLHTIIPDLKRYAFVTVLTTSIHDIINIHANLLALETVKGDLRGIPLIIRRAPREISTPGADGKRVRREKWLITIEAQPQWVELQLSAQERAALPQAQPLALPEWEEDDEEIEAATNGHASPETLAAINSLWPKYGTKRGGQLIPFADYVHQQKGVVSPDLLKQDEAERMLTWLQQRALTAHSAAEERETMTV